MGGHYSKGFPQPRRAADVNVAQRHRRRGAVRSLFAGKPQAAQAPQWASDTLRSEAAIIQAKPTPPNT